MTSQLPPEMTEVLKILTIEPLTSDQAIRLREVIGSGHVRSTINNDDKRLIKLGLVQYEDGWVEPSHLAINFSFTAMDNTVMQAGGIMLWPHITKSGEYRNVVIDAMKTIPGYGGTLIH